MGHCESIGKCLLVIINIIFSLIGLVLLVFGCLVRSGSDIFDEYLQSAYNAFQKALESASNGSTDISSIDINMLVGDASVAFIVIGVFFFVLGIFGCIGAVCKVKILLIVYTIVLATIFIAELVCVILLFTITSKIDGWIKAPLVKTLTDQYTWPNGTNAFTISLNFVMHEFKCCGIDNYTEFQNATHFNNSYIVPPMCCKYTNDTACQSHPVSNNSYIGEGCYTAVKDWLSEQKSVLIGVGAGVTAVQLLLIIFAIVICCKSRKNDDKDSYSEEIPIEPYRESPEAMGHRNMYYSGTPQSSQSDLRAQNQYAYTEERGPTYVEPYRGRSNQYTGPPTGYDLRR